MRILAIDTATEVGNVAVSAIDEAGHQDVLAEASAAVDARHGETLLPHIEDVMGRSGLRPQDLSLLAVGLGPGSFTGVRIGLATAKGLSIALQIPLVGVGTLEVIARGVDAEDVLVVIDAKKSEVFAARYRGGVEVFGPVHGTHDAVAAELAVQLSSASPPILVGGGSRDPRFLAALGGPVAHAPEALDAPQARVLSELAWARFEAGGASDPSSIVPRYVRGADATPSALAPSVLGPSDDGTKSER